jgi:hypothetical protein
MVLVYEAYELGVAVFRTRLGCETVVATFRLGALWLGLTYYAGVWMSVMSAFESPVLKSDLRGKRCG